MHDNHIFRAATWRRWPRAATDPHLTPYRGHTGRYGTPAAVDADRERPSRSPATT